MSEKFRYENNIYFLTSLIRILSDAIKIRVDEELFAEKILETALFIDITIQRVHTSLEKNSHLLQRNNYRHSLMKLKKQYNRFIEDVLAIKGEVSPQFEKTHSKLRRSIVTHLKDIETIRTDLSQVEDSPIDDDGRGISSDELHFLMTPIVLDAES